jgi:hypothetical protein
MSVVTLEYLENAVLQGLQHRTFFLDNEHNIPLKIKCLNDEKDLDLCCIYHETTHYQYQNSSIFQFRLKSDQSITMVVICRIFTTEGDNVFEHRFFLDYPNFKSDHKMHVDFHEYSDPNNYFQGCLKRLDVMFLQNDKIIRFSRENGSYYENFFLFFISNDALNMLDAIHNDDYRLGLPCLSIDFNKDFKAQDLCNKNGIDWFWNQQKHNPIDFSLGRFFTGKENLNRGIYADFANLVNKTK